MGMFWKGILGAFLVAAGCGTDVTRLGDHSESICVPSSNGSITNTGSLGTARAFAVAAALPNGKVLVAGGANASGAALASAELYDPVSGTFIATGSMANA